MELWISFYAEVMFFKELLRNSKIAADYDFENIENEELIEGVEVMEESTDLCI